MKISHFQQNPAKPNENHSNKKKNKQNSQRKITGTPFSKALRNAIDLVARLVNMMDTVIRDVFLSFLFAARARPGAGGAADGDARDAARSDGRGRVLGGRRSSLPREFHVGDLTWQRILCSV